MVWEEEIREGPPILISWLQEDLGVTGRLCSDGTAGPGPRMHDRKKWHHFGSRTGLTARAEERSLE